mmetsp:Transcript_10802/g.13326  ORF Transcript_10802/g.13326 Transcript_10802/m.13326 type:complete len:156 (+) Transcript_10802:576-1043(+)
MQSNTHRLTKEQIRAVDFINRNLGTIRKTKVSKQTQWDDIQVFRSKPALKDIPCGKNWRWNQTKKIQTVHVADTSIQFRKLIPRKNNPSNPCEIPDLKLWQYMITNTTYRLHVLWYERGYHSEPKLSQYSFLGQFMDPNLATLFWPSTYNEYPRV